MSLRHLSCGKKRAISQTDYAKKGLKRFLEMAPVPVLEVSTVPLLRGICNGVTMVAVEIDRAANFVANN